MGAAPAPARSERARRARDPLHQDLTDLTKSPVRCDVSRCAVSENASQTGAEAVRPRHRLEIDRTLPLTGAEWAIVAVFAVASFALFGLNAVDAAANNRVFLGAAGASAQDSMQYLAWATDAAHHGLIANLYGFNNGGHVFFTRSGWSPGCSTSTRACLICCCSGCGRRRPWSC